MRIDRRTVLAMCLIPVLTAGSLRADQQNDIVDTAISAGSFKTLAAALGAADLVDALKSSGPFTVFAPTDEAFAKLPEGTVASLLKPENKGQLVRILKYHVVSGNVMAKDVVKLTNATTLSGQRIDIKVGDRKVMVDNANVVNTDIRCSNGVIHVIDSVILPNSDNIPTTAGKAGKFKTLIAAAKAGGLVNALSRKGPLTVFAPTDDAFAKLPKGTVESLLKPENKDQLVSILKYHVVAGRVFSDAALKAKYAKTLEGAKLNISVRKTGAYVNNAKLVTTDIDTSNGVIHVIDQVLLPPKKASVTAADAKRMIEHAIARGVHLYNSGHHHSCAEVYEQTMARLVSSGNQMPPLAMRHLQTAMNHANVDQCATSKAWTLRRGLDAAYAMVGR